MNKVNFYDIKTYLAVLLSNFDFVITGILLSAILFRCLKKKIKIESDIV